MNLAWRDVRHNIGRFVLTAIGIGMLLMTVMGMSGIYRGLIEDATNLVDRIDADLWVVQADTRGPFAEISRVPLNLEQRVQAVPGVAGARGFLSHTIQREHRGRPLRMVVQGLSWPDDKGEWIPLSAGRPLAHPHHEMIADELLGLRLGDRLPLGKEIYTVVGLTRGMVGQGGDGMAFFSLADAAAIQNDQPAEAIRLERAGRRERLGRTGWDDPQPELLERAGLPAGELPALSATHVGAVIVDLAPGVPAERVAEVIGGWGDVSVFTSDQQRQLLLQGSVDRSRRQIGLFRTVLVIISAIIMALIIYTLTLDKVREIAMLKLMGARATLILGMILQQSLLLGAAGYGFAWLLGQWAFEHFPRRVIVLGEDLVALALVVLGISILASLLGIWKALRVEPNEILS